MNEELVLANQTSSYYAHLDDAVMCKSFVWAENETLNPQAVIDEIHKYREYTLYILTWRYINYPIPFMVRIRGIWRTAAYRDRLIWENSREYVEDRLRYQMRCGVCQADHSLVQWMLENDSTVWCCVCFALAKEPLDIELFKPAFNLSSAQGNVLGLNRGKLVEIGCQNNCIIFSPESFSGETVADIFYRAE